MKNWKNEQNRAYAAYRTFLFPTLTPIAREPPMQWKHLNTFDCVKHQSVSIYGYTDIRRTKYSLWNLINLITHYYQSILSCLKGNIIHVWIFRNFTLVRVNFMTCWTIILITICAIFCYRDSAHYSFILIIIILSFATSIATLSIASLSIKTSTLYSVE